MREMEPEGRYTIIGALLLLLVACAIGAGIWLTGYVSGSLRYYTVYFEHQSLRGLQIGGEVNARGLKIGRVEGYSFSPDSVNRVKVDIRVDSGTPVAINTVANIGRNLVTGVARIDLETPNPPDKALSAVPPGEAYPVIAEGTSEFDQFSDSFNRIAVTGEAALANLRDLLTEENRRTLSESIVSIRDLSVGLTERLAAVDAASASLSHTADSLQQAGSRISAAVERTSANIDAQIGPLSGQATRTLSDIRNLVAESQRSLATLTRAAGTLEQQTTRAVGKVADSADVGLLELRATARDLRIGMDNLNRTLERYQDPRAAFLGPADTQLGPGEKRP
jgi:phospholipid/cholesterol/gamma-HCH transport system substrate-binding protein